MLGNVKLTYKYPVADCVKEFPKLTVHGIFTENLSTKSLKVHHSTVNMNVLEKPKKVALNYASLKQNKNIIILHELKSGTINI